MAYAIWITGLPGSGKSTIAKELVKKLDNIEYLRLDEIRKKYIKDPKFTDEERQLVYSKFIDEGVKLVEAGKNVLFDATAHKLIWRQIARSRIPNFMEVYVQCSIETCMNREASRPGGLVLADLYKKALERKRTGKQFPGLGEVVGVDIIYEENKNTEIMINSDILEPWEAAREIVEEIKKKGWA